MNAWIIGCIVLVSALADDMPGSVVPAAAVRRLDGNPSDRTEVLATTSFATDSLPNDTVMPSTPEKSRTSVSPRAVRQMALVVLPDTAASFRVARNLPLCYGVTPRAPA